VLASAYAFGFTQCQPSGITNQQAHTRAAAGAKAADLSAQIDAFVSNVGDFAESDLVTVLVGTNDIVEQYQAYSDPAQSAAAINAELTTRGAAVAAQVNRIANAGGKVLAVTVPDVGVTPFAVAEEKANAGRAALLKQFSASFNLALRLGLINDGRKIGLVLGDELVQSMAASPTAYALTNVTEHACDPVTGPLPDCTSSTLFTDDQGAVGSASTWLWAGDLQMAPTGHARLGSAALSRAQNNPF
jgi:outer membrane lipase/esterase